jgi:cation diffusion facilitator family transporter
MRKAAPVNIKSKVSAIRWVLFFSIIIMLIKFSAWYFSKSEAILSDALESFINIATSFFALYSLFYASKLKDADHPYGHGKIEYLAVGFEGALIFGTGIYIIINAIHHYFDPHRLQNMDIGIGLTIVSTLGMYWMSRYLRKKGAENNSAILKADGQHFKADAITSGGLIIGLFTYKMTGWSWIDPTLAILLALHIMGSGIKLLRESINHLLDKADMETIESITTSLQQYRDESWIDIHNLRLQKFGHYLHVDCHLTLPFFYQLDKVHEQIKKLEHVLNLDVENQVEVFVHTDPCMEIPCNICSVKDCTFRKKPQVSQIKWTSENLMLNKKHQLTD